MNSVSYDDCCYLALVKTTLIQRITKVDGQKKSISWMRQFAMFSGFQVQAAAVGSLSANACALECTQFQNHLCELHSSLT